MGAVGGLDALHCEQRRREKAEAAAQAWWAKAEEEAKEFSNAMRTVFEQTERSTKLLYSSSVRKENRMICRCSWAMWRSQFRALRARKWFQASYDRLRLGWTVTLWSSISKRSRDARCYAAQEFARLKGQLKLSRVLRVLRNHTWRRRRTMGMARRGIRLKTAKALGRWHAFTAHERRTKRIMAQIIHRLKNSRLLLCMELWQENTKEQILMKSKLVRIIPQRFELLCPHRELCSF